AWPFWRPTGRSRFSPPTPPGSRGRRTSPPSADRRCGFGIGPPRVGDCQGAVVMRPCRRMETTMGKPHYTVPSLTLADGGKVAAILQQRLDSLNDLALTLKHVHWNVVGPNFISVHEMIDPQVLAVRAMVDQIAERIATLGVSPQGTPGGMVQRRSWDDYSIGRADAITHLGALDVVYQTVIADHRQAAEETESLDPVTNDMLIGHLH